MNNLKYIDRGVHTQIETIQQWRNSLEHEEENMFLKVKAEILWLKCFIIYIYFRKLMLGVYIFLSYHPRLSNLKALFILLWMYLNSVKYRERNVISQQLNLQILV